MVVDIEKARQKRLQEAVRRMKRNLHGKTHAEQAAQAELSLYASLSIMMEIGAPERALETVRLLLGETQAARIDTPRK